MSTIIDKFHQVTNSVVSVDNPDKIGYNKNRKNIVRETK